MANVYRDIADDDDSIIKRRLLVDENGELWRATKDDPDAHARKLDGLKRHQENERWRSKQFTFSVMDSIAELVPKVKLSHLGYLLMLQTYIDYDGYIKLSSMDFLQREDVMRVLDIKTNAYTEFMRTMKEHGVIHTDIVNGIKCFRINEHYHFKGKTNNPRVVKVFNELRKLYPKVSATDIGFLFTVIPWIHYRTNALVHNPDEKSVHNLQPLTVQTISERTGVNVKTVYRKISNMKLGDEYIFERTENDLFVVNPRIIFRGKGAPDATLTLIFDHKNSRKRRGK